MEVAQRVFIAGLLLSFFGEAGLSRAASEENMRSDLIFQGSTGIHRFTDPPHAVALGTLSFLTSDATALAVSNNQHTRIIDLSSRKTRTQIRLAGALAYGNGDRIAAGTFDGRVKLYDIASGSVIQDFDAPGAVVSMAYSSDGKLVAAGGASGELWVWNTATGKLVQSAKPRQSSVEALAFGQANFLASADEDGNVFIWEAVKQTAPRALSRAPARTTTLAFLPNSDVLLVGGPYGIEVWDSQEGKLLRTPMKKKDAAQDSLPEVLQSVGLPNVRSFAVSNDARLMVLSTLERPSAINPVTKCRVAVWDLQSWQKRLEVADSDCEQNRPFRVAISRDGHYIAASIDFHNVTVWQIETKPPL